MLDALIGSQFYFNPQLYVIAGVTEVLSTVYALLYSINDSSSLTNEKDHHYFLNSADVCW